tara:strand:+ start:1259 stop:1438 length:180 start_codon:yes stop_codon:yes gene_type:complete
MNISNVRLQEIRDSLEAPPTDVAWFQILISLADLDSISTDAERIALIDQIITAINAVRE